MEWPEGVALDIPPLSDDLKWLIDERWRQRCLRSAWGLEQYVHYAPATILSHQTRLKSDLCDCPGLCKRVPRG